MKFSNECTHTIETLDKNETNLALKDYIIDLEQVEHNDS